MHQLHPQNDFVDVRDRDGALLFRFSPARQVIEIKRKHRPPCEVALGPLLQAPVIVINNTIIHEAAAKTAEN